MYFTSIISSLSLISNVWRFEINLLTTVQYTLSVIFDGNETKLARKKREKCFFLLVAHFEIEMQKNIEEFFLYLFFIEKFPYFTL